MYFSLLLGRLIGFPVWWYGRGLLNFLLSLSATFSKFSTTLGLRVWMKNLFVPMYGDRSFAGRVMSFVVRCVMILARGFCVFGYGIILCFGFVLYLTVPLFLFFGSIYHLL